MENIILVGIIIIILGLALVYIIRERKNGRKCIGCPDSKNCNGNCGNCVTSQRNEE